LRVASNFALTLAPGTVLTCTDTVKSLLGRKRGWEVRSAGTGSKGERWYAWAWLATASPRHSLLVRRHLKTGDIIFYAYPGDTVPHHVVSYLGGDRIFQAPETGQILSWREPSPIYRCPRHGRRPGVAHAVDRARAHRRLQGSAGCAVRIEAVHD
jgi:NlpC/P60 family